jgi:hypothetical protein
MLAITVDLERDGCFREGLVRSTASLYGPSDTVRSRSDDILKARAYVDDCPSRGLGYIGTGYWRKKRRCTTVRRRLCLCF